jgi:hypothetical protein
LPLPCQPENKSHVPRHRLSLVHATKPGMEYGGWAGASTNEGANRRSRNHIEICPAATLSWIPKRRATADQIQEDMHFRPISVRAAVCLRRERERFFSNNRRRPPLTTTVPKYRVSPPPAAPQPLKLTHGPFQDMTNETSSLLG